MKLSRRNREALAKAALKAQQGPPRVSRYEAKRKPAKAALAQSEKAASHD